MKATVANPVMPGRRLFLLVAAGLILLLLISTAWRAWSAYAAYRAVTADIAAIQSAAGDGLGSLSVDAIAGIEPKIDDLRRDLQRLDGATAIPLGGEALVGHLPWIGPRYAAGRAVIRMAELLAGAGKSATGIGREVAAAFQSTGTSSPSPPAAATWLDVLGRHEADLERIGKQIDEANALRAGIDERLLPAKVRERLESLDRVLKRFDLGTLLGADFPAFRAALGGDHPVRYLVLFQNPAELRLNGGFNGTIALITIERGQLQSYEFSDVYDLAPAYIDQRKDAIPPPWPVEQYFGHRELPIQDATWWTDFSRGGAEMLAMYGQTNWPPIDGVIAVQPVIVSDLLQATGPVTADVDGEPRSITPENVADEIERERRLQREGLSPEDTHKEVLALIGKEIIERLKTSGRGTLLEAIKPLGAAAERRDLQVYAADPAVQAMFDQLGWTGRLDPGTSIPVLAVAFSDTTATKASQRVQPDLRLTLEPPVNGRRNGTLQIALKHTGTDSEDPFYAGYMRWWTEVVLPPGSSRVSSDPAPAPDPEAPNGGSYTVDLFPQQTGRISVAFSMPDARSLLVRRQPGLTTADLTVTSSGCQSPTTATLTNDVVIDLGSLCR